MLKQFKPWNVLFLDVETVPAKAIYDELDDRWKHLWEKKTRSLASKFDATPEELYERAGIYSEFGKIVCISSGIFEKGNSSKFRIKSFWGDDEREILKGFSEVLARVIPSQDPGDSLATICAHNGKEFDYPYIARRCLINGLNVPDILDNAGKKPWEVNLLDTMEMWKFGDYKSLTSLDLLSAVFGIASPKDIMDGSEVAKAYWEEKDLNKIKVYCQKDVITLAKLFLKFRDPSSSAEFETEFID